MFIVELSTAPKVWKQPKWQEQLNE
jgi:hypothetical protein